MLARRLIIDYDWRFAMLVIGDLVWLVVIPVALLVRNPPASTESSATGGWAFGPEMTVGQALSTPQFAAIAVTHLACCAAHSGPLFHMVTHVIDHGVPAMTAVTVLGTAGVASIGGRVACGMLADRFGVKPTLVVWLLMQAVAVGLYLVPTQLFAFYALATLFGVSYGGVMPLYAILVREYFGIRIMGAVFGAVAAVSTLGMALGPWAGGFLYDAFGSYAWLFIGAAAFGLGAAAIALTFRPPAAVATA